MHKVSRVPLKGAVLAQKALQGSETETRELLGGTTENSVSRQGFIDLPSRQIMIFYPSGFPNILFHPPENNSRNLFDHLTYFPL